MPRSVVDGHQAPDRRAAAILPAVAPGAEVVIAGLRHGAEAPHQLAGLDVERLRIAGRADERVLAFASRRGSPGSCRSTGGDDIEKPLPPKPPPPPPRHRARQDRRGRQDAPPPGAGRDAADADPSSASLAAAAAGGHRRRPSGMHVGDALGAEALDRLAGRRIERPQLVAGAVEQACAGLVVTRPVRHRAHRASAHRRLEAPQFLAGLGLERDDAAVLQRDVHRRADDDRRVLPLAARHLGVELPRLGQPGDVLRGDLRQRREARVSGIVAVGGPASSAPGRPPRRSPHSQGSATVVSSS